MEKRPGICDVKLTEKPAAERAAVVSWEQKHCCTLPEDLRSFYLTTNGIFLKWNVKMNDARIPVGKIEINPVEKLVQLGGFVPPASDMNTPNLTLLDLASDLDENESEREKPKWDHRSRIFELEPCDGYGKVCLVYRNTAKGIPANQAEIWFLDRAMQWDPLAGTFLHYYRMLLLNLGLPQWQYAFTDIGLSPNAKQWFQMYSPLRVGVDGFPDDFPSESPEMASNPVDIARLFRGKLEKKKTANPAPNSKRKAPVSSAKLGAARSASNPLSKPPPR